MNKERVRKLPHVRGTRGDGRSLGCEQRGATEEAGVAPSQLSDHPWFN